jgi:hypothetical protein
MSKASLPFEIFDAQEHSEEVSTDLTTDPLQGFVVQPSDSHASVPSNLTMGESGESDPSWDPVIGTNHSVDDSITHRLEEPWDPTHAGYEPEFYDNTGYAMEAQKPEIAGYLGTADWVPQQAPYPGQGPFDSAHHQEQDFPGPEFSGLDFPGLDFRGPEIQGRDVSSQEIIKMVELYVASTNVPFMISLLMRSVE